MRLFSVDPEKCNRDGICVETCPMQIIALKDSEAVPEPTEDADSFCVNCGQCVAVCPTGAFSLKTMTPETCPSINREWLLDGERAEQFLRSRRSIRTYTDKTVDRELLVRLIKIARCAPSGHNTQPVRWRVIYDAGEVRRLAALVIDWIRNTMQEQPEMPAYRD